jgi:hypothetical protein
MDSLSLSALEKTVKTLMSPVDEETWRKVGLFDKVDQLKGGPEGLSKKDYITTGFLSSQSTSPLHFPMTSKPVIPPSVTPSTGLLSNFKPQSSLLSPSSQQGHREPLETTLSAGFIERRGSPTKRLSDWC